jgi:hypothetical protein
MWHAAGDAIKPEEGAMAKRGTRVTVEALEKQFRLGEPTGSYPLDTVTFTFVQFLLVVIVIAYLALAAIQGGAEAAHGSAVTASLLFASLPVLPGLIIGWRWLARRRNLHRCLSYEEGLVTTGWFGHVRGRVLRSEITRVLEVRNVPRYGNRPTHFGFRFIRADGSTFYLSVPAKNLELHDDVRRLLSRTRPSATA